MKKIALISAIALSGLFYNSANAQLRIGLGIHINTPSVRIVAQTAEPVYTEYAPADDYYYLPEVDAYYSVPERVYYYNNGYNWVSAAYLPGEYRNYDWRSVRHYELHARKPYLNADVYREKYRGRENDWGRYNDNHAYANRDDRRNNEPRFEKRNDYRGTEHAGSRGRDNGNYNRPTAPQNNRGHQRGGGNDDHFVDNHGQRGRGGFKS